MTCGDIFLALIAVLFPPIAVWIKSGICSVDSLINILLCMLGYLPGLLHAWYIIARNPERDYDYEVIPDSERGGQGGRVTYYYIRHETVPRRDYGTQAQSHNRPAPPPPAGQGSNRPAPPPPSDPSPQGGEPAGPSVGAGSDEPGAPPSYSEVVKGDHKIQSQD
ncbi:uncharacterized protein Z520_01922 [Fonsecaea multimorphosa CBS 102226]|uniref:Stress response RCI peptide n=1 Tax=Fonsecaea multimorphosa CBS 102226 TaxID=1442371 RepID=A0A0D2KY64_9EURO|nr:uncharacterized protein Z520_01922 [Fonsecaea multimorphosa CBS 102226]KIY01784.1 hypothetical protein Z520_01922 [Fonsecaea multimorphosa CBS 102226]OAL29976.1 hypothetical protein AYO22_01882 [Fonsecaea multimorphosa]